MRRSEAEPMLGEDARFHLLPIAERWPPDVLWEREHAYLAGREDHEEIASPPHRDLSLVIVIPAFNEEAAIGTVLGCLTTQDLPASQMEIVVVDNASHDGTAGLVLDLARSSPVPIHLVAERRRGCHRAIRKGMDEACGRLAQVRLPSEGAIATIDADDQVGPRWARSLLARVAGSRADMVRGPTKVLPPLPPKVEARVQRLCDVENRANGYAELARLRVDEALLGSKTRSCPRWLPRITGPNIAITPAAYTAVGGLDPRPPGDQASHLANPLLRMGGCVVLSGDPALTLLRSSRPSYRDYGQARGHGVGFGMGFGDMLESAWAWSEMGVEGDYPDPTCLESGLNRLLRDLGSRDAQVQQAAREYAARLVSSPSDPSGLCRYGDPGALPERVPLSAAADLLAGMTHRAEGLDYRTAERFLMAREHLRQAILSTADPSPDANAIVDGALLRMGFSAADLPAHVEKAAAALRGLTARDGESWFNCACQVLEEFYVRLQID